MCAQRSAARIFDWILHNFIHAVCQHHAYRNHQHVIGNVKGTTSKSLVMTLEGFVILTGDDLVDRVNVDTLCLNIIALQSRAGQLRMYSTQQ